MLPVAPTLPPLTARGDPETLEGRTEVLIKKDFLISKHSRHQYKTNVGES
jgi:hypothetical protein